MINCATRRNEARTTSLGLDHVGFVVNIIARIRGWLLERAAYAIPECEILTVVNGEEQVMVGVMCAAVDVWAQNLGDMELVVVD